MKRAILGACLSLYVSASGATIIYSTPGTVLIQDEVNDSILIDDSGVALVVDTGGVVRGPAAGGYAIRTMYGSLDVTGTGRVEAGAASAALDMTGGGSVVRLRDNAAVVGRIQAEGAPGWRDEATAYSRLYLQDSASVTGSMRYGGFVSIADNAVLDGWLQSSMTGNIRLDMSGGEITGGVEISNAHQYIVNLSGGTIQGALTGYPGDVQLNMSGGIIRGGLNGSHNITGEISGGQVLDGIRMRSSTTNLQITGGQFDAALDDWLLAFSEDISGPGGPGMRTSGLLEISGGEFGYASAGRGLFFDNDMSLDVIGYDLVYAGGWLTGYLQDGSWFSNALTFGSNWQGAFNIHNVNVPEPGTLALLLIGAFGCAAAGRRRVAGSTEPRLV